MSETALRCVNHPGRETRVKCSACGSPVCVQCMRESAVGIKCPDCSRLPRRARRAGKPRHLLFAGLAGLGAATAAGVVLVFFGRGLIGIFLPFVAGLLVGEAVLRASSRLRDRRYLVVAGITTFLGVLGGPLLLGLPLGAVVQPSWLIGAGIATAAAVYRVSR